MEKKILSVILAMALALGMGMSVWAYDVAEGHDDPFNNDLFEIVKEFPRGALFMFGDNGYSLVYEDDSYLVAFCTPEGQQVLPKKYWRYAVQDDKLFCFEDYQNENGEWVSTYDVFDTAFNPTEGVFLETEEEEHGYNDGLMLVDSNYGWNNYRTIDGKEYNNMRYSSYNLGYFLLHGDGFPRGTDIQTLNGDKVYYFFHCDFSEIDDNYYATMTINELPEEGTGDPFYTDSTSYRIRFKAIIPTVQLDGVKIKFDQIPVIESGRTLVPVRAIFEAMGASIDWNGGTQTVTAVKDDITITLKIDDTEAKKNGETIKLDVPAKVINGRTMVPVRFIADCFGVDTDWDGDYQIVRLTSK